MFAGKSTELLRRVLAAESDGVAVALVKSQKDGRYSTHEVVTHDGTRRSCHTYGQLMDFLNMPSSSSSSSSLGQEQQQTSATVIVDFQSAGVIAIDEAQFFPDLLQFCSTAADIHGKRVIIAGLDGDFKRSKFGQILDLIPMADSVTKLTATCKFCEEDGLGHVPALFSLRLVQNKRSHVDEKEEEEEEQELVGGAEIYAPACRHHFVNLSSKQDR
jgi:thymidine kinase